MKTILIVEDERHLADGLRYNLNAEGYSADIVADAEIAFEKLEANPLAYDVIVLDVMLPGMDGFALASKLRAQGHFVPILMLTARGSAEDVLRGFEAGADDYLPKPFDLSVLLARIHALLRRREWFHKDRSSELPARPDGSSNLFDCDNKTIDCDALELRSAEQTVSLTLMEAQLLRY